MTAFFELHTERPPSEGVAPIPVSKIKAWIREQELDEDEAETMMYHVRALDNFFIQYCTEKMKRDAKAAKHRKRR